MILFDILPIDDNQRRFRLPLPHETYRHTPGGEQDPVSHLEAIRLQEDVQLVKRHRAHIL
jgi:hypothetical protein